MGNSSRLSPLRMSLAVILIAAGVEACSGGGGGGAGGGPCHVDVTGQVAASFDCQVLATVEQNGGFTLGKVYVIKATAASQAPLDYFDVDIGRFGSALTTGVYSTSDVGAYGQSEIQTGGTSWGMVWGSGAQAAGTYKMTLTDAKALGGGGGLTQYQVHGTADATLDQITPTGSTLENVHVTF